MRDAQLKAQTSVLTHLLQLQVACDIPACWALRFSYRGTVDFYRSVAGSACRCGPADRLEPHGVVWTSANLRGWALGRPSVREPYRRPPPDFPYTVCGTHPVNGYVEFGVTSRKNADESAQALRQRGFQEVKVKARGEPSRDCLTL